MIAILRALLGPALRLHGSKLNMKSAKFGSPVEWHQDWAFYPHTNDDILAIGVLLDDTTEANGPLLCVPGTHTGPVWDDHGADGRFAGMIDPAAIAPEIGRAGAMSFHHVRTRMARRRIARIVRALCCCMRSRRRMPGRCAG